MLKVGRGLGVGGGILSLHFTPHRFPCSRVSAKPHNTAPHSFQSSCHRVCSTSQHDDATQTIHQDTPANQNETQHKHAWPFSDDYVPAEGLVLLLLDLQLRRLQAQGFPGLRLLEAAIAPALLHLGRQPPTAAVHWIVAAHGTKREEKKRKR